MTPNLAQVDKISVIIPTVNAWEELDLAIASIKKNSDYLIDFCIVVDPDMNTGKVNSDILKVCQKHNLEPHINKDNLGPYGNWNRGAEVAKTDWLVFATDDQYFAPHWDRNLLQYWKPKRLVAGRLVEPGIIPVWRTNLERDFGVLPSEFKESEFNNWVANRTETGYVTDGFFIPMLQHRSDYDALGHYPTAGKFGTSTAVSNDVLYVQEALKKGYEFGTAADSYSYHFQASSWKKKTLKPTIAAVVLTHNSGKELAKTLKSVKFASETFVIDSNSSDQTLAIAKKHGAKIHQRDFDNFAAQRNFALEKAAKFDWVFFIDDDEVVEKELVNELKSFAKDIYLDGVEIPRKNFIFGKWIKHTDWYPDYRLVFVRPKMVTFEGGVHERVKYIKGNGTTAKTKYHLLHQNYLTLSEFVQKNLLNYPQAYAQVLKDEGVTFAPAQLVTKPLSEFMRRFFLCQGYKDGLYGLILSLLMGVQTLVAYAYLWEIEGKQEELTSEQTQALFGELRSKGAELTYWLTTVAIDNSQGAKKYFHRARRKALKLVKGLS